MSEKGSDSPPSSEDGSTRADSGCLSGSTPTTPTPSSQSKDSTPPTPPTPANIHELKNYNPFNHPRSLRHMMSIRRDTYCKDNRAIGVFTSGGDSSGQ